MVTSKSPYLGSSMFVCLVTRRVISSGYLHNMTDSVVGFHGCVVNGASGRIRTDKEEVCKLLAGRLPSDACEKVVHSAGVEPATFRSVF